MQRFKCFRWFRQVRVGSEGSAEGGHGGRGARRVHPEPAARRGGQTAPAGGQEVQGRRHVSCPIDISLINLMTCNIDTMTCDMDISKILQRHGEAPSRPPNNNAQYTRYYGFCINTDYERDFFFYYFSIPYTQFFH